MEIRYVGKCRGKYKTSLKNNRGRRIATLIWGDPVHVLEQSGGSVKVRARGWMGWIRRGADYGNLRA